MRCAGDHSVGAASVHEHRAEVRDVAHPLLGVLEIHALVLAEFCVGVREFVCQLGVVGIDEFDAVEVDSEVARAGRHRFGVAEDDQFHDSAA